MPAPRVSGISMWRANSRTRSPSGVIATRSLATYTLVVWAAGLLEAAESCRSVQQFHRGRTRVGVEGGQFALQVFAQAGAAGLGHEDGRALAEGVGRKGQHYFIAEVIADGANLLHHVLQLCAVVALAVPPLFENRTGLHAFLKELIGLGEGGADIGNRGIDDCVGGDQIEQTGGGAHGRGRDFFNVLLQAREFAEHGEILGGSRGSRRYRPAQARARRWRRCWPARRA